MSYKLELEDDEVGVVVEALRIQRERWQGRRDEEDGERPERKPHLAGRGSRRATSPRGA